MFWINPVLIDLGALQIRWYGLVYFAGFLLTWRILIGAAHRREAGLTPPHAEGLITWMVLGTLIGSRIIYYTLYNAPSLAADPLILFKLWKGGMSFHGAFLGVIAASYAYCRKHKLPFLSVADIIVLPASLMLALGRVANFINGELVGTPTSVPWCVDWTSNPYLAQPPEGCRHPSQLYAAAKNLLMYFILLGMQLRLTLKKGTLFWTFVLVYGTGRLATDFLRTPDPGDPVFLGLLIGQWLSLAMAVAAAIAFLHLHRQQQEPGTTRQALTKHINRRQRKKPKR
ncbi:MAG: prolipoprotein diacylglyceryl transferase [Nitrosarchaeum sp.]|nr:prolipoprotein diacylglyceryl transferase [Nitrosarchaeum sp.]